MGHVKLHIPGPVEVSEKTFPRVLLADDRPSRQGFKDLYAKIQPQLQQLLSTKQLVYISTSSAWGVMEGAIRNLVAKKVLNCMCGAFSDKWLDVSKRCGKEAEALQVPWGSPIRAEEVDKKLATGQFDALTVIHNETSTGVMSPLAEIAALKKKYPDVMFIVDSVSSMTARAAEVRRAGHRRVAGRDAKGLRAAAGHGRVRLLARRAGQGRDHEGPRLLFRLRRVPEERGAEHDPQHAEHRARVSRSNPSWRTSSPKAWRPVTPGIAAPTR